MRRLFTTAEASARGLSSATLRWGEKTGRWRRIERGVYGVGSEPPTRLDVARARVIASGGAARAGLAGVLHDLDSVRLALPARRLANAGDNITVVEGVACANGLLTLIDLAATLDDDTWEQALESALRKKLTTVAELESALPELGRARVPGTSRM